MRTLALLFSLALLVSLLALAVRGLVTWGGDDDETTTAAVSEIATVPVVLEKKSCGRYLRWTLVVGGDISCREARRVFRGNVYQKLPRPWVCSGPDGHTVCMKGAPAAHQVVITATF
jgi:hypothetical protein